jgi:hypothetical protein
MSALGLGRVKSTGSIDASWLRDVAVRGHIPAFGGFVPGSASDQDFSHPERFCKSRRTGVGGDYALIAAISGLVPMMFMTRVIL